MIRRDLGASAIDFYSRPTDFNVVMVMALFDCSSQHYDVTISIGTLHHNPHASQNLDVQAINNGSLRSCSARQPFNYSVMLYIY